MSICWAKVNGEVLPRVWRRCRLKLIFYKFLNSSTHICGGSFIGAIPKFILDNPSTILERGEVFEGERGLIKFGPECIGIDRRVKGNHNGDGLIDLVFVNDSGLISFLDEVTKPHSVSEFDRLNKLPITVFEERSVDRKAFSDMFTMFCESRT